MANPSFTALNHVLLVYKFQLEIMFYSTEFSTTLIGISLVTFPAVNVMTASPAFNGSK